MYKAGLKWLKMGYWMKGEDNSKETEQTRKRLPLPKKRLCHAGNYALLMFSQQSNPG
jgi:hypothetical protein